jgi:hypothetical protein
MLLAVALLLQEVIAAPPLEGHSAPTGTPEAFLGAAVGLELGQVKTGKTAKCSRSGVCTPNKTTNNLQYKTGAKPVGRMGWEGGKPAGFHPSLG